jgi:hypothetical protein
LKGDIMPFKDPAKRKAYQKQYQRKYYLNNKDAFIQRSVKNKRQRRQEKKDWLHSQLGGVCQNCGYDTPAGLDIHHTDSSLKQIWGLVRPGQQGGSGVIRQKGITDYSWQDLKAKIHTLELLCANCHREHHAESDDSEE